MKSQTQHQVPAWMLAGQLWAQACDLRGEIESVERSMVDMGGRTRFDVACEEVVFLVAANVYGAPSGGEPLGRVVFPVPREVRGPVAVDCVLAAFSH